jgi:drug/metabolite transporter (DMT)-like permease
MKFTTVHKAFLALIIANIIWGAAAPIFKLSLQNIPPFTLAFLRFFLGAIVLVFFLGNRIKPPKFARGDTELLLINAVSGITLNIALFFIGLTMTLSINAPVIASAAPIMTLFFALLLLKEKFVWKKFLGMLFGTIGILVIVFEPILASGLDGSLLGNILLVGATVAAVVGTITGKKLCDRYNPHMITFWTFVIGAVSFLPLAIWEYIQNPLLYTQLDGRGYTGIVFGALLSSALAYILFNWGLSKITATDTAIFTYIDPVVGSILAVFLLHEPITGFFIIGSSLIFAGIFFAEGRLGYHPFHLFRRVHEVDNVPR